MMHAAGGDDNKDVDVRYSTNNSSDVMGLDTLTF